jgi:hypothetical protein
MIRSFSRMRRRGKKKGVKNLVKEVIVASVRETEADREQV